MINEQVKPNECFNLGRVAEKSDDDVVLVAMARTAITKGGKGPQRNTAPEAMLVPVLQDIVKQSGIDPKLIEDVCIGNCLQPGAGAHVARMGMFVAGYPHDVSVSAINRQCSSGLSAVAMIANSIRAGQIEIGIGGGVESMSMYSMTSALKPENLSPDVFENEDARNCMLSMGITSENVAQRYGISRQTQDQMAVDSHAKAAHCQKQGWHKQEITPYKTIVVDKDGNETEVLVDRDDGVREGTTLETLAKLKPAF